MYEQQNTLCKRMVFPHKISQQSDREMNHICTFCVKLFHCVAGNCTKFPAFITLHKTFPHLVLKKKNYCHDLTFLNVTGV